jgi:uncharacterized protein (TIGR00730 family)
MIKSVCVFCGSRNGAELDFEAAAAALGCWAAKAGLEVIYGGGHVGLMGVVADAAMQAGARVVGLIPERLLELEAGHRDISELIITKGMFDRKEQMIARADAFLVLPGGLGTLDELFEVLTLGQLGYHDKPILLLDINGYWQPLLALIERVIEQRFASPDTRRLMVTVDAIEQIGEVLGIQPEGEARHAVGD